MPHARHPATTPAARRSEPVCLPVACGESHRRNPPLRWSSPVGSVDRHASPVGIPLPNRSAGLSQVGRVPEATGPTGSNPLGTRRCHGWQPARPATATRPPGRAAQPSNWSTSCRRPSDDWLRNPKSPPFRGGRYSRPQPRPAEGSVHAGRGRPDAAGRLPAVLQPRWLRRSDRSHPKPASPAN